MKKYYIILGPIVFIFIWFIVNKLKIINPFFLPGPVEIWKKLFLLLFNGDILKDLFFTIVRVAISFNISLILGIPIGLFIGSSRRIYKSLEFIIDFFRSTPSTAIFPIFLLIFGIDDKSKIAVAAFASILVIIFNTAYGVLNANKSRILAAKIMGATKKQIFFWILFWESLPQTFIGIRNAISVSLVIIVVTEMFIGTDVGLGRKIIDFQITYEIPDMYATILLTGIVGYLFNLIFILIEKRTLHWIRKN